MQNGALANGKEDKSLHHPSCLILSHTCMVGATPAPLTTHPKGSRILPNYQLPSWAGGVPVSQSKSIQTRAVGNGIL